jgi:phospholipid/cholesterol/gamma-HCH transport system substrate-binding protein
MAPAMKTRRAIRGRSFGSRNPTTIGAIGLVLVLVVLWAAFNASKLPIIGGGTTYSALFTEDAGLQSGDDVTIAGVKVGTVSSTALHTYAGGTAGSPKGTFVKVDFRVKHAFVGNQSTVAIKLKTLLGAKYLAIDSIGQSAQPTGQTIPAARTTSPFDIYPAFTELTQTVDSINTNQLAQAFTVLAQDFSGTPASVQPLVQGLTRLSTTIASRDSELQSLLQQADDVTGTLASRDQQLQQLINDGGLLLEELNERRDAIHSLLVNTTTLSQQLEGLVADNQKTLGPMLDSLHGVLTLLQDNQNSLDQGLALLGPFYRLFNNTIGSGRWFDNYICNLSAGGLVGIAADIDSGSCL